MVKQRKLVECAYCKKEFAILPSSTLKYCSKECYKMNRKKIVSERNNRLCKECGIIFHRKSWAGKNEGKFCSRKCADIYRSKHHQKQGAFISCKICGKEFFVEKYDLSDRKVCSVSCLRIYQKIKGTNQSEAHKTGIKMCQKDLESKGYRVLLTDNKPRPDLIAFKDNKVYAYEIDCGGTNKKKYEGINFFDDIIWISIKEKQ